MKLKVVGSGSKGNAYVLHNEKEALLIECGTNLKPIIQALDWDLGKVSGCIVTHEHNDHSKTMKGVMDKGIDVYATEGTFRGKKLHDHHRANWIEKLKAFKVGSFKIMAFDVEHDANDPVGFLIEHSDCGRVLFLTDTFYCKYKFEKLNNLIIEANYSEEMINSDTSLDHDFLKDRIKQSHMSLETCIHTILSNGIEDVNNIVLIHLSDRNSDEEMFKRSVEEATARNVSIASEGLEIEFNKTPF